MKKLGLTFALALLVLTVSAQKSIDELFKKYSGKDGFTTVTVNGALCRLATCFDHNEDEDSLPMKISSIRILTQDDDSMKVENFYDLVIRDIDLNSYEEFMSVKESHQDVRILVKADGKKIREFLMIAGGDDNALIQIKGEITLDEAKKLSENAKKDHNLNLSGSRN
jgi:hypothetical protein